MKVNVTLLIALAVMSFALSGRVWAAEPFAVVELFSSQGCSSCPPADDLLIQLTRKAKENSTRVYTLSFHVDYWDHLGWRDPYSKPEFTKRQNQYAKVFNASSIYTPQMIINGQQAFVGSDRGKAKRLIDIFLDVPAVNTLTLKLVKLEGRQIELSFVCDRVRADAVIHFALVESGLESRITAGENKGRVLINENVVREFETVPLSAEGKIVLNSPPDEKQGHFAVVAYVQNAQNMRIYAADRVDLK